MPSGRDQAGPYVRLTEHVIEQIAEVSNEPGQLRGSEGRVVMASHGYHLKFDALSISSAFCEPRWPAECFSDLPA